MDTTIKIDDAVFNNACTEVDNKRVKYEAEAVKVKEKLDKATGSVTWKNMSFETYTAGATLMKTIQDQSTRNLYFLSNVLQQVKLDFEAADQAGADVP